MYVGLCIFLCCLLINKTRRALDRGAYLRRPLDHLTITLTLTLTFDLIFIGWQGIVTDYPYAKFGDFSFSRFGWTDRQNSEVDQHHRRRE